MAQESNQDPISFGNHDDDTDSLFGGSDDGLSCFSEVAAVASSQELQSETASIPQERAQEAANPAAQLHLPEVPAPAPAQSQAQQTPHRTSAVVQLTLPAVPDPLVALSSHQDGHTSGDIVVSTQKSDSHTPTPAPTASAPEEFFDDAALDAQLEALWESVTVEDQPVNALAGSRDGDAIQDDDLIPVTRVPEFRYANSMINARLALPRRIDLDLQQAEELAYFMTLNRKSKFEHLYSYLELSHGEGKRLGNQLKALLKTPELRPVVEQAGGHGVLERKRTLVRTAFYILVIENWGTAWFGDNCPTAQSRTLFWPRDSTILLLSFALILYRILENQRNMYRAKLKYQRQPSETISTNSPSPSSPSSPPPCTPLIISPPESPPPPENNEGQGQVFFAPLVKNATAAKKRKRAESILGSASASASASAAAAGLSSDNPYELEVPANARLTYRVYVKDRTDGSDLAPAATYRHTDAIIAGGAFAALKASFEAGGHEPVIEIQTPSGRKGIASAEDWESAVLAVYNMRRSGGVVEVDVFV